MMETKEGTHIVEEKLRMKEQDRVSKQDAKQSKEE